MPAVNAVVPFQPELRFVDLAGFHRAVKPANAFLKVVRMNDPFPFAAADQLRARQVEIFHHPSVYIVQLPGWKSGPHLVEDAFAKLAVAEFAGLDSLVLPFSFGDVAADTLNPDRL